MSHVATVELEVRDLGALAEACRSIGLEFVADQHEYRWFGGDYPLPDGFTADELGKCEHAIRIPGKGQAYEIGVVRRRDGRPGFSLLWDFYARGFGLEDVVGKDCRNLRRAYAATVAKRQAMAQGFQVHQTVRADGSIQMRLTK